MTLKAGWKQIHPSIWMSDFGSYLVEHNNIQIMLSSPIGTKAKVFNVLYEKGLGSSQECFQFAHFIIKHRRRS